MSRPASKALIGAFVLGGLALAFATVMMLGSGRLFSQRLKFDLYFTGSVKGLQVGSPVMFKGVPIGHVTDIALKLNLKDLSYDMPVEIEIEPKKIKGLGSPAGAHYSYLKPLIDKGLRAQLQTVSLLTGQLMVGLDFHPEMTAHFVAPEGAQYPEIPTIPTQFEELQRRLQGLPLEEISKNLNSSLAGVSRIVNSPAARDLSAESSKTLEQLARLIKSLNSLADYLSRHPEALIRGKAPAKGEVK